MMHTTFIRKHLSAGTSDFDVLSFALDEGGELASSQNVHTRRGKCKLRHVNIRNTHIKQHWPEIVRTDFKFVVFDLSVSL